MVDAAGGGGELLFTAAAGGALLFALTAPGRETPGGNSSTCPDSFFYQAQAISDWAKVSSLTSFGCKCFKVSCLVWVCSQILGHVLVVVPGR